MKQVLQSLRNGTTSVMDIPVPQTKPGYVLVKTSKTLISAGTERMLVNFGSAGWMQKARQQPEKIRMVLDKIGTDGVKPTLDAVLRKLDQPIPMGYCNVGTVAGVGSGVRGFQPGERIVSNGSHAEVVNVPVNLCAAVPDNVSDEEASFTILGAIALQGIRLVAPTLGETVVVTGLGLIGLLTVQLLRANGCRVLGIDIDSKKLEMARQYGAETVDLAAGEDPVIVARKFSRGRGADAVIIAASSNSDELIRQAAQMSRKRGRVVLIGTAGMKLSRDEFFKRELTFQVSTSYGPGRYDPNYEEKGQDYPVAFVRWTEQRNFEAVLDMMADGRLDVRALITHRFEISEAPNAYELICGDEPTLGVVLDYPGIDILRSSQSIALNEHDEAKMNNASEHSAGTSLGFIGAGNYASSMLIPAFKNTGANLISVASSSGITGVFAARKFQIAETTTDVDSLLCNPNVDALVVSTRHDSHAEFVVKGLLADKHVFVEKPLCISSEQLNEIIDVREKIMKRQGTPPMLMVGFNRRFSPHVQKIKELLAGVVSPVNFIMSVNAGHVPTDHWTQDTELGGGRLIGEACHFIDLLRFLAGSPVQTWSKVTLNSENSDTFAINLKFENGSIGTIHYYSNGAKSFPKERLEVCAEGGILQLDNFRKLTGYRWRGFKNMKLWRQDKGQRACAQAFVDVIAAGGPAPIPFEDLVEISGLTIEMSH